MPIPRLFLGPKATPVLLQTDTGYTDNGIAYDLVARSQRFAPAGTGGECIFTTLFVTTTHFSADVQLYVTPIVDGVALAQQSILLAGVASSEGEVRVHELGLSIPYLHNGVERLRSYPRGVWIQVLVETRYGAGLGVPARQLVNLIEVEFEPVEQILPPGQVAT